MKIIWTTFMLVVILNLITVAQNETLIHGYYVYDSGQIGILVGPKSIKKIKLVFTPHDANKKRINAQINKYVDGPLYANEHYVFNLPYGSLGKYKYGEATSIIVQYIDGTTKYYDDSDCAKIAKLYYKYLYKTNNRK